jgi:hypothetical protein
MGPATRLGQLNLAAVLRGSLFKQVILPLLLEMRTLSTLLQVL